MELEGLSYFISIFVEEKVLEQPDLVGTHSAKISSDQLAGCCEVCCTPMIYLG